MRDEQGWSKDILLDSNRKEWEEVARPGAIVGWNPKSVCVCWGGGGVVRACLRYPDLATERIVCHRKKCVTTG